MDTKRKLQRRCGPRILSSPHLDLLLTAVTWGHTWTGRLLFWAAVFSVHVCSLSKGTRTHTCLWTLKITIHSTKSTQGTHTASCLFGYTSSAHTLTPAHALTQTHTSQRPPSPYCPSIWLVPFVPHILLAADGKLLQAGGAEGACPDLLKTYNITWDSAF